MFSEELFQSRQKSELCRIELTFYQKILDWSKFKEIAVGKLTEIRIIGSCIYRLVNISVKRRKTTLFSIISSYIVAVSAPIHS